MRSKVKYTKSQIKANNYYQGESIEEKMRRVVANGEPIKDGAPIIYTPRKDGVIPAYDIRTDRWEIAQQAMDKSNKTWIAERDAKIEVPTQQTEEQPKNE